MNCPACSAKLSQIDANGLSLDVCTDSCGGAWFDAHELEKVDEMHEPVDSRVLRPLTNQNVAVDRNKKRNCPKCVDQILKCHLEDPANDLFIDLCTKCEGAWLDFAELDVVRAKNSANQERSAVIDDYINQYAKDPKNAPRGLRAVCELLFR